MINELYARTHASILLLAFISPTSCRTENLAMHEKLATIDSPAVSPSGKLLLHLVANETANLEFHTFQILDKFGDEVYTPHEQFDVRHQLFFLWGDNDDVVWVYSGDLGTFFWQEEDDTSDWVKSVYARSKKPAPSFLKEKRPRYHKF